MTSEVAYFEYTRLVNRNATNNHVNVDKGRFVLAFNDMQDKYLQWLLDHRSDDTIRIAQKMLLKDQELSLVYTFPTHSTYSLSGDYFEHANLRVIASKDCCEDKELRTFEVKSENTEELWADEFQKPSFEFEETFYFFTDNKVSVARDGFDISKVCHTYYRYPNKIDISGYINFDGNPSTTINPEWDDKVVRRILLAMSTDFAAINDEQGKYALDKDRLFTGI